MDSRYGGFDGTFYSNHHIERRQSDAASGAWHLQIDRKRRQKNAIVTAAKYGYRLIDTASSYKNEDSIGRGIRASGIPRENFFYYHKGMEYRAAGR